MGWPVGSGDPLTPICRIIRKIQTQILEPHGKHVTSCPISATPGNILNSALSYPTELPGNLVESTSKLIKLSVPPSMLTRLFIPGIVGYLPRENAVPTSPRTLNNEVIRKFALTPTT